MSREPIVPEPASSSAHPAAGRGRVGLVLTLVAVVALGAGLWFVRWSTASSHASGDTFWYTRQALLFAGRSEQDATAVAASFIVREGRGSDPAAWVETVRTIDPRYVAIFESRPVYPLVAAPFVGVSGTDAMTVAALLAGLAFAVVLGAIGWAVGGPVAGLTAVASAYVLPTGAWLAFLYADGWMFATLAVSLGAAAAYLRGGDRRWLVAFAAALGLLFLTKSANGAVLVAATIALAGAAAIRQRTIRTAPVVLAITATAIGAAFMVALALLGLPGLNDTLQDLFTQHFERPDVASPWLLLARRVAGAAPSYLLALAGQPLIVAIAAVGLGALLAARAWWAGLFAIAGVGVILTVAIHPVRSEIPRLMAPIWISVALGWALLAQSAVDRLVTRFGRRASPAPG